MAITKKQSSSEQIIDYIVDQIATKQLKPGDKLMNEREFSERLGVSRIPLREAISALSLLGILDARQGNGTYLNSYDPSMLARIMEIYSVLDEVSMEDLFEMRAIVEAEAAKLAAKKGTENDLLEMRSSLLECDAFLKSQNDNCLNVDQSFEIFNRYHSLILKSTHNTFFCQFMDSIRLLARRYHRMGFHNNPYINEQIKQAQEAHWKIFRAIAAQDADRAYELTYDHLIYEHNAIQIALDKNI